MVESSGQMNLGSKAGLDDVLHLLKGKRVLIRVDFNVPLKDGAVKDPTRIVATLPTLNKIIEQQPTAIILMSHLGRPDGQVQPKSSLKPVAEALQKLINKNVQFLPECIGEEIEKACLAATGGQIILLENLRFHAEEEGSGVGADGQKFKPTKEAIAAFRASLTKLGEVYINDAFGTAHRAHSSMTGINLPVKAAGYLMKKEIEYFGKALESPNRPLLVILGGAKVKDKIKLIKNLLKLANEIIIGGGMAFTFLKVLNNMKIGKSIYDEEGAQLIADIMKEAKERNVQIHLPIDFVCGDKFENNCNQKYASLWTGIDDDWAGYDIGEKTIALNSLVIRRAKTVVWNGPSGVFEFDQFAKGSLSILNDLLETTKQGAITIVGGGDTVALVQKVKGAEQGLSHVSTGGGASLELLEGTYLPGIKFLDEKK